MTENKAFIEAVQYFETLDLGDLQSLAISGTTTEAATGRLVAVEFIAHSEKGGDHIKSIFEISED